MTRSCQESRTSYLPSIGQSFLFTGVSGTGIRDASTIQSPLRIRSIGWRRWTGIKNEIKRFGDNWKQKAGQLSLSGSVSWRKLRWSRLSAVSRRKSSGTARLSAPPKRKGVGLARLIGWCENSSGRRMLHYCWPRLRNAKSSYILAFSAIIYLLFVNSRDKSQKQHYTSCFSRWFFATYGQKAKRKISLWNRTIGIIVRAQRLSDAVRKSLSTMVTASKLRASAATMRNCSFLGKPMSHCRSTSRVSMPFARVYSE